MAGKAAARFGQRQQALGNDRTRPSPAKSSRCTGLR
jgi:hypothetical protein